jgi:hypothetical protein
LRSVIASNTPLGPTLKNHEFAYVVAKNVKTAFVKLIVTKAYNVRNLLLSYTWLLIPDWHPSDGSR